ncbi:Na(+)/H(+) exchanger protein 2-like isoform X2 [Scylla paramamosain]|uniref:Na(+)/H(+) exchanger protein 2-like isoform X2 n=1 Tax=Scylla paramamosain TaxID=85552 RepID=UPI003082DA31
MKTSVLLLACVVWCALGLVAASTPTKEHHTGTTTTHEPRNETLGQVHGDGVAVHSEGEGGHGIERYPVAVIDFERVQTPFIIGLWIFLACLGKIGFHMTPKISHVFPESCMLIILGVVIGVLLIYTQAATVSPLTADVFFLYLLPPIILDAGYFMPNRLFFDNLFTILVFAVVGTIWNALTIGITMYAISLTGLFGLDIPMLHMFLFSSLISAVDPVAVLAVFEEIQVEEVLYILVFGESLLNDGVTVVLYHLFEGFSELGEDNIMAVDIASGVASFLTAFVTRLTREVRVIEPIFVFVMSYLAYLNAEIFHLSGILSITFCGITMKNYVEQNISTKSHTTIKYAMKMLASSSETIIFMFLGVSTIQSTHDWNTWFVILTILFCSIYRILGVLIFSVVCNRFRVKKIGFVDKFVMCYGGLRGAVAFALVITINPAHIPLQPMFLTATIAMVYFTVFVQGITIKPLVQLLGVKKSEKRQLTMNERLHERVMDYIMSGFEDVLGKQGHLLLRNKFKRFNNKYLTPFLVRDKNVIEPKLLETYSNIKMHEALEQMHNSYNSPQNIESFSNLLRNAATHPHVQMNNQGEWNLDVAELEYNPTVRDINDAKFHHLLSNDYKPLKKSRGSTYKRHAVKDDDMQTQSDISHHNMYLHTRQFVQNDKKLYKKAKKLGLVAVREEKGASPQHVPTSPLSQGSVGQDLASQGDNGVTKTPQDHRAAFQQNGSAIKLKQDYIARVIQDNPAFVNDDGTPIFPDQQTIMEKRRQSTKGPTMAEMALPWKRYYQDGEPQDPRRLQRALSIVNSEEDGSQPTLAEAVLPWKRPEDEEVCQMPVKQNEFPAWASNKEYVNYYSPSSTFLGKLGRHDSYPNIREIFERRNSSSSIKSRRGSLKEHPMPLRERSASRGSIDVPSTSASGTSTPTTAHDPSVPHLVRQRTSTDCSLLNTTIVEEDRRGDTVIDINPSGTEPEQTRM